MTGYDIYDGPGDIPFNLWRSSYGIELPILDKDGTLSDYHGTTILKDVAKALIEQMVPYYDTIGIVSNNEYPEEVRDFAVHVKSELGLRDVLYVSPADGLREVRVDPRNMSRSSPPPRPFHRKSHPEMGMHIAWMHGVRPDQLGVIGDRRLTDVSFGKRLGAGAVALVGKQGEGDARFVPTIRRIESGIVMLDRIRREADEQPKTVDKAA